jgi:hypothetical protein
MSQHLACAHEKQKNDEPDESDAEGQDEPLNEAIIGVEAEKEDDDGDNRRDDAEVDKRSYGHPTGQLSASA